MVEVLMGQGSMPEAAPPLNQLHLTASLCEGSVVLPVRALVDSGAQDNPLDETPFQNPQRPPLWVEKPPLV